MKWFHKVLIFIFIIICSPIILFGFILFFLTNILPSPVEIMIYKRSEFYKKFQMKYDFGITHNTWYKITRLIKKHDLDLEVVRNEEEEFFYIKGKNDIYINLDVWSIYHINDYGWLLIEDEDSDEMDLLPYVNSLKEKLLEEDSITNLYYLVEESCIEKKDISKFNYENFLLYKQFNDLFKIIK